ncbi:MAG: Gfo/Idh/MocA family oxidoreductase, partial [Oscillospiraceae bacterium]|jgi:predicted dehydrogenase|nr:Gfo/Idh/MocA family oxidoreductase [Oscillospiraceae bacterium]
MAASLEECDAMIKARDESGKTLSIIAQNRFRKPIRDLKELLDSGIAGPVRHAQIDSYWWRGHCYYDLYWRGKWETEGGGCTLNHAVHHIDMLGWMMGLPEKLNSMMANTAHDNAEIEDLSVAVLKYPTALAQVTSSVVHHAEEQQVIFQCEKARIAAPVQTYASVSKPNGFPTRDEKLEAEIQAFTDALPDIPYEGHTGQIENVVAALEKGVPPAIGGEDGRRTIELITGIYKSGSTGETVSFPLEKSDPFYTVEGILKNTPKFYEKTGNAKELTGTITYGSAYEAK